MKKLLVLVLFTGLLVSCKEKDLSEKNPPLSKNNVQLVSTYLFLGNGINRDSLYTNNVGNQFYIESVKLLVGNVFIVDGGIDTTAADESFLYSIDATDLDVLKLPAGGYSAYCGVQIGLDSMQTAQALVSAKDEDSPFNDLDIKRSPGTPGFGYNHLIIKGRVIDSSNPDDSTGTIPLLFQVGTYELLKTATGENYHFAVNTSRKAKFILSVDIGPALMDRDLEGRPLIVTDPTDAADYNAAVEVLDNTIIQIF
jgi:hypothetical protein